MKSFRQTALALVLSLGVSALANATLIDFTSQAWKDAITSGSSNATVGDVTLKSIGGPLTFNSNASERSGCQSAAAGLACLGDGIGINNDEVSEGYRQFLTIEFASAVNILNLHLLDLFGNEGRGERAWIEDSNLDVSTSRATGSNAGGYWETGYSASNLTWVKLYSLDDNYSDFALARVSYTTAVPEPGTLVLLSSGLLGLGLLRRRNRV